jgi:hypothetical protein
LFSFLDSFARAAIWFWKTWLFGNSSAFWNGDIRGHELPLLTNCGLDGKARRSSSNPRPLSTVVYRCPLASGGLQAILDVALAASGSYGKKMRKQGITRNDFPHGLGTEHGVRHAYAQGDLLGNRGYVRICRQYIQNPHSGQEAHLGALCSWVSLNFPPQKQP